MVSVSSGSMSTNWCDRQHAVHEPQGTGVPSPPASAFVIPVSQWVKEPAGSGTASP